MTSKLWPPTWVTPVPAKLLDNKRARLAIEFIEAFGIITKDSAAGPQGQPLVLRDWQKELIRHVYADDGNGGLRHRINLLGLPRKSGKSAVASSLAVYDLLFGPNGGEVYSVAAEKEQARIVFADAKRMVEAHPDLLNMVKLYRDAIEVPTTSSVYRVLTAENLSKEGLSPTCTIFDELHAQKNRELFDVFSLAMAARPVAHVIAITTAGTRADSTGQDSIAYTLYQYGQRIARGEEVDPSFFMAWYEAPHDADHKDPKTWQIANPGLGEDGTGDICTLADFESAVKRTPEAEFRTKRLNQWVNSQLGWLPSGAFEACAAEFEIDENTEYVLGFDGSFSGDASVIVGCTYPSEDTPPRLFMVKAWEKDLTIHDDNWRVDIADVENTIIEFTKRYPKVREIACDPFRWQRSLQALDELGLPMVEYPSTSPARMVPATAKFADAVIEGRLEHDGDPLLARHIANCVIKQDSRGPRIVKENRGSPRKIDGAVAALLAFDRATHAKLEEVTPQIFV